MLAANVIVDYPQVPCCDRGALNFQIANALGDAVRHHHCSINQSIDFGERYWRRRRIRLPADLGRARCGPTSMARHLQCFGGLSITGPAEIDRSHLDSIAKSRPSWIALRATLPSREDGDLGAAFAGISAVAGSGPCSDRPYLEVDPQYAPPYSLPSELSACSSTCMLRVAWIMRSRLVIKVASNFWPGY